MSIERMSNCITSVEKVVKKRQQLPVRPTLIVFLEVLDKWSLTGHSVANVAQAAD